MLEKNHPEEINREVNLLLGYLNSPVKLFSFDSLSHSLFSSSWNLNHHLIQSILRVEYLFSPNVGLTLRHNRILIHFFSLFLDAFDDMDQLDCSQI